MCYCIYLRKSRADAEAEVRGEGETLARHEKALLEFAHRQGLNITQIYREIVSGETIAARPVVQQLLSEVAEGRWAGVLVMEVERLARGDTIDQGIMAQSFKYSGTLIITPSKTYDPQNEFDEEYFEFGLFMSRREYKTINRRLQRGRIASIKEGKYVANQPPYGYLRKKLEGDKGFTLEAHPDQAPVVRMIYEWYTRGELQADGNPRRLGTALIARRLNELRIPPQKGATWVPSSVRDILINPVYIGKLRWGWRPHQKRIVEGQVQASRPRQQIGVTVVDGLHGGIIDPKVFDLAQEYMSQNPPVGTSRSIKNPLAGIVRCGVCGRAMVRRPYSSGQADTLLCYSTACSNVSAPLVSVEAAVLTALSNWLNEYKLHWNDRTSTPSSIEDKRRMLKTVEQELASLEKQRSSVYDLLEQGVYDTDTFLDRSRAVAERLQATQKAHEQLAAELNRAVAHEESRQSIVPKIERLLAVYHSLSTPQAKNDMLKAVLEKVVYIKEHGGRWHYSPDDFSIEIFPRLPKDKTDQ